MAVTFGSTDQPKITSSSSSNSPPARIQASDLDTLMAAPLTPKKRVTSAIHEGLSMIKDTQQSQGPFKYFEECSMEQYLANVERETEKWKAIIDRQAYALEKVNQIKKINIQERARERKQKSRMLKKRSDIRMGLRSPGGTKKRVCPLTSLPYT